MPGPFTLFLARGMNRPASGWNRNPRPKLNTAPSRRQANGATGSHRDQRGKTGRRSPHQNSLDLCRWAQERRRLSLGTGHRNELAFCELLAEGMVQIADQADDDCKQRSCAELGWSD